MTNPVHLRRPGRALLASRADPDRQLPAAQAPHGRRPARFADHLQRVPDRRRRPPGTPATRTGRTTSTPPMAARSRTRPSRAMSATRPSRLCSTRPTAAPACATAATTRSACRRSSASCLSYISRQTKNRTVAEQQVVEANLQGGLFNPPAGQVRGAFGASYKRDTYLFEPDSLLSTGDVVGFNAQDAINALD
ncbi:hypothetical protein ACRAWD_09205 [Caulobacter segnis]